MDQSINQINDTNSVINDEFRSLIIKEASNLNHPRLNRLKKMIQYSDKEICINGTKTLLITLVILGIGIIVFNKMDII